ncbi:MAG: hypothetical protein ABI716_02060, partial [Candidatus Saccharibacteria bacterium]
LEGSLRQTRGQIISALSTGSMTEVDLRFTITADERFSIALKDLINEGLVSDDDQRLHLTK